MNIRGVVGWRVALDRRKIQACSVRTGMRSIFDVKKHLVPTISRLSICNTLSESANWFPKESAELACDFSRRRCRVVGCGPFHWAWSVVVGAQIASVGTGFVL